ncbi:hypothetical protein ADUPG1_010989, partial [Aduncisulcus paluster]
FEHIKHIEKEIEEDTILDKLHGKELHEVPLVVKQVRSSSHNIKKAIIDLDKSRHKRSCISTKSQAKSQAQSQAKSQAKGQAKTKTNQIPSLQHKSSNIDFDDYCCDNGYPDRFSTYSISFDSDEYEECLGIHQKLKKHQNHHLHSHSCSSVSQSISDLEKQTTSSSSSSSPFSSKLFLETGIGIDLSFPNITLTLNDLSLFLSDEELQLIIFRHFRWIRNFLFLPASLTSLVFNCQLNNAKFDIRSGIKSIYSTPKVDVIHGSWKFQSIFCKISFQEAKLACFVKLMRNSLSLARRNAKAELFLPSNSVFEWDSIRKRIIFSIGGNIRAFFRESASFDSIKLISNLYNNILASINEILSFSDFSRIELFSSEKEYLLAAFMIDRRDNSKDPQNSLNQEISCSSSSYSSSCSTSSSTSCSSLVPKVSIRSGKEEQKEEQIEEQKEEKHWSWMYNNFSISLCFFSNGMQR